MKLRAFAVYDSKAEAYMRPFFAETKGLAVRSFADAANDPQSPMHKHAADYTLFEVGSFDQLSGQLLPGDHIESMGNALTFQEAAK